MLGFRKNRRIAIIAGALIVAGIVVSNSKLNLVEKSSPMTPLPLRIQPIFDKTRTICVGRYLIDIPETAIAVYGPAQAPFTTVRYVGMANEMGKIVGMRIAEIKEEGAYAYGPLLENGSMVGKVLDGAVEGQKIVFGIDKSTGTFYDIRSYIPVGDDVFMQKTDVHGTGRKYQETIDRINTHATQLRPRREADVPVLPGVCIDGGLILVPPEPTSESITLGVRLKEFPDVHFSISMTKKEIFVESDGLEDRLARSEEVARASGALGWFARVKILRRGSRQIEGWKGHEILAHKPSQKLEGESHEFAFVSHGEPKNPFLPVLDIQMDSGVMDDRTGATPPSVTDAEALALWDKLLSTIRVRPTGSAAGAGTPPPST